MKPSAQHIDHRRQVAIVHQGRHNVVLNYAKQYLRHEECMKSIRMMSGDIKIFNHALYTVNAI